MNKKVGNPFMHEKKRAILAKRREYAKLISTYSLKKLEIEDKNTPEFWNRLNKRNHVTRKTNPIAYHRINIVSKLIGEKTKVLNVGAGAGDLESKIFDDKDFISKWYGIDISPTSINNLNKEFPQARFKVGNILKIPFKDKLFDYVVLMEILEHIKPRNIFKALNEVGRVLKDNGYLVVTVPLNEGLEDMVKRGINPNAHIRVYTPELISAELNISGFDIINKKTLYAFHNGYILKSLIAKYLIPGVKKPNNLILFCKKNENTFFE